MTFAAIALSSGRWAIIDLEDFDRVSGFRWTASNKRSWYSRDKWYAIRRPFVNGKRVDIALHYFVLDLDRRTMDPDVRVDHKNNDSLDCRKSNLEVVSHLENMRRSPGWRRRTPTWGAA